MVIGIDIDDTIVKTSAKANEILHRCKKNENVVDYHYLSSDEYCQFVDKNIKEITSSEELMDDVVEILNYFKTKGIKLIFITARSGEFYKELIPITTVYFHKNGILYDEIIFGMEKKGNCAKSYNVDLFIDDKEIVLDDVKKYGIKTLKFDKENRKSNHHVVPSWLEIKDYVDTLLGGE